MSESPREVAERIQRAVHLVRNSPYIPKAIEPSAPQWAFISSKELEVLYAGSVGGGKSVAALISALMYAHVPGYSALLIRKNFPDLAQPGGLMYMANEWLGNTDAHRRDGGKVWEFPSGATLRFGHIETPADWIRYQGGEYQYICIDELPTLEKEVWDNLKSRLRRSTVMHPELADIPDRMRGTGNPGGRHAQWVKEYFISDTDGNPVKVPNRLFLPSRMTDNPALDAERYAVILDNLDPVRRAQMRDGDWNINPIGHMFTHDGFRIEEGKLGPDAHRVRVWDLAGSGSRTSDFCAGALLARDRETGTYRIEHMVHGKYEPAALDRVVRQTAELDGVNVPVLIEEERSGSGKLVVAHFRRLLKGYVVRSIRPTGDKTERASLFSALADRGEIELTRAAWNEKLITECVSFPEAAHDDMVDAVSHGCHYLARLPVSSKPRPRQSEDETLKPTPMDKGGEGVPDVKFILSRKGPKAYGPKRSPLMKSYGRRIGGGGSR